MHSLRDYHDLYQKTDVLLLADVFEEFRNVCLRHYKLDPAWYYTSPGLAWDACLKMTQVDLELLHDASNGRKGDSWRSVDDFYSAR